MITDLCQVRTRVCVCVHVRMIATENVDAEKCHYKGNLKQLLEFITYLFLYTKNYFSKIIIKKHYHITLCV